MNKVVIIGGGIAGLSAGIYALQSGFEVTIFEMHTIPGGNSTSWKREGYFFEGGMHWLTGSAQNQLLYKEWCNLGALSENVSVYIFFPYLPRMRRKFVRFAKILNGLVKCLCPLWILKD